MIIYIYIYIYIYIISLSLYIHIYVHAYPYSDDVIVGCSAVLRYAAACHGVRPERARNARDTIFCDDYHYY